MMKITSKGQVTIPKQVRDTLGLLPGTEVEIELKGSVATIRKDADADRKRGEELVEHLKHQRPHFSMTTDEIMALTRGED